MDGEGRGEVRRAVKKVREAEEREAEECVCVCPLSTHKYLDTQICIENRRLLSGGTSMPLCQVLIKGVEAEVRWTVEQWRGGEEDV